MTTMNQPIDTSGQVQCPHCGKSYSPLQEHYCDELPAYRPYEVVYQQQYGAIVEQLQELNHHLADIFAELQTIRGRMP